MIQQNRFTRNANLFVNSHVSIEGTYLLNKNIDPQKKIITLIYGGRDLTEFQIKNMKDQLELYGLNNTSLNIKQGISFLPDKKETDRLTQLTILLNTKEQVIRNQKSFIDSLASIESQTTQILNELRTNYPEIVSISIQPHIASTDLLLRNNPLVLFQTSKLFPSNKVNKIEEWLKIRLNYPMLSVKQFR